MRKKNTKSITSPTHRLALSCGSAKNSSLQKKESGGVGQRRGIVLKQLNFRMKICWVVIRRETKWKNTATFFCFPEKVNLGGWSNRRETRDVCRGKSGEIRRLCFSCFPEKVNLGGGQIAGKHGSLLRKKWRKR